MSESAVHTKVTPQSSVSKPLPVSGLLQRKCACGQHTGTGGECESCRKKHEDASTKMPGTLQRAAITSAPTPTAKATADSSVPKASIPKAPTAPPIVNDVLRSPGKALDAGTRSFMEPRFGQDFSQVRVHTDNKAANSARAVNARAYTVGQHVVFGPGEFAPDTTGGRHLLAHELTHTMQQKELMHLSASDISMKEPSHLEHEAETISSSVISGRSLTLPSQSPTAVVQRTPWGDEKYADAERLSGSASKYNKSAELFMLARYQEQRGDHHVAISPDMSAGSATFAPIESLAEKGASDEVRRMIRAMKTDFVSLKSKNKGKKETPDEETQEIDASGQKKKKRKPPRGKTLTIGDVDTFVDPNTEVLTEDRLTGETADAPTRFESEAQAAIDERGDALRRPDIADITQSEVYDVTTIDQAPNKVAKINSYVQQLESIRSEAQISPSSGGWKAGKSLKPPTLLKYLVKPEILYFGKTDFDTWPGVLVYEVIKPSGKEGATSATGTEPFTVDAGGKSLHFQVTANAPTVDLQASPDNKAEAESLPGVILKKLEHSKKKRTRIEGRIESKSDSKSSGKSKVPLKVVQNKGNLYFDVVEEGQSKQLKLGKTGNVDFEYDLLSKGVLHSVQYDFQSGLSAKGKLKPSIPLLSKAEIDVALEKDTFSGKVSVPKDKLSPPVKGFRVTKGEIGVELSPMFGASGEVAFEVGPEKKPIVDGSIKAKADENGFIAQGDVYAHLPGIDEAKGNITYRKDGFSGGIDVNFTQTKLKYIKGGTAHIGFVGSEIKAEGAIIIQLPRGKEATVSIHRGQQGNWIYKGTGEFDIPKLDPVKLEIEYDGEHLTAKGHTGIVLQGLKGDLAVQYRDGRVSGEGKLALEKGRAKGFVHAKLSDALNISGEGEIQYQLSENLIGTVGVILHEDQSVRLRGALDFPKPIHLFKGFGEEYTLFNYGMQIPILAIPLGPVSAGLVGTIDGGMKVNYGLGPGELRGVHIEGSFNPLEESKDVDIKAGATLVIPAHAGISLYIRGGVGVSIAIASVTGGITAIGTAELRGGLEAPVKIEYSKGRYSLNAEPEISAELVLKLGLDADITAEAGVRGFKVEKKIVWNLAAFEWGSGLKFGLIAPLHYASDEPFRAPSASDIKFVKPAIDLKGLVPRLAKQAGGGKE